MKKVVVIIEGGPFNNLRTSEAFRMSVGLTLSDDQIAILLINDGVYNLLRLHGEKIARPSIYDYIDVFEQVTLKLCVDADSMIARKIETPPKIASQLPRTEVLQMIRDADVVIPFR